MTARPRTLLTVPIVEPYAGVKILLEIDETDARALEAGTVPTHVRAQCRSAIDWCEADADGYAKGWRRRGT